MDVEIKMIPQNNPERTVIECHEITDHVREIEYFVKSREGKLCCTKESRKFELPITEILYAESVDNRTFLYTDKETYEAREKLNHLEEMLKEKQFLRISKSMILNLMKLKSVKPALNGRFSAVLSNGEEVIISRKYVSSLKETLRSQ